MNIADVAQHIHALEKKVKEQADEIKRLREALLIVLANSWPYESNAKTIRNTLGIEEPPALKEGE